MPPTSNVKTSYLCAQQTHGYALDVCSLSQLAERPCLSTVNNDASNFTLTLRYYPTPALFGDPFVVGGWPNSRDE